MCFKHIFNKIIDQELVYTVFQPIVDLDMRKVFAYEALSRISEKQNVGICISDVFKAAEAYGEMWTLDKLCRKKALKAAKNKPGQVKLFLNVDGNVMHEESFVQGFTKKRLEKYDIDPGSIIFEITERSEIDNYKALIDIEKHYRSQGYEIAIDDVGSGYSNLNRIVYTNPEYLKIDMELVRDLYKVFSFCVWSKNNKKYYVILRIKDRQKGEHMKIKVYGADICIDCRNYKAIQKARGFEAEYVDIIENTSNLKEFLSIRDNDPIFETVREHSGIGIPLFVNDDGQRTLDINEAFAWIGQSQVKDEEIVEHRNSAP